MTSAATPEMRSTRPSADATRDRIIKAATELFSDRSYDGASTHDIAAAAGVTQPLVNYHFNSKEALWRAAVDALFDRLTHTMEQRARGLRGVDAVTSAKLSVREFIIFSARNPELHRIIMQESKANSERMDYLVDRHVRPIFERTVAMFESLSRAGAMPDIPPAHLYYILTGAGPTMFVLAPECRRLTALDPSDDDVIEAHAEAVCQLLFGSN